MRKLILVLLFTLVLTSYLFEEAECQGKWGFIKKFITGRKSGGSGKPRQHFVDKPNRKTAQESAREAGKGNRPEHHQPHKPDQKPHYHPTNKDGSIKKDGSHYNYPK